MSELTIKASNDVNFESIIHSNCGLISVVKLKGEMERYYNTDKLRIETAHRNCTDEPSTSIVRIKYGHTYVFGIERDSEHFWNF